MSMSMDTRRKKVLCPITKDGKDGNKTTFWVRMGTAYVNKDNSINLYLDCLPTNGKLHVRDWDEPGDRRPFVKQDDPSFTPTDNLPF